MTLGVRIFLFHRCEVMGSKCLCVVVYPLTVILSLLVLLPPLRLSCRPSPTRERINSASANRLILQQGVRYNHYTSCSNASSQLPYSSGLSSSSSS